MLRLEAAERWYGGLRALGPLDLELGRGETLLVTGRNGSGKSTLLALAAGRRVPTRGRVAVLGLDPAVDHRVRARIGHLGSQGFLDPEATVEEILAHWWEVRGPGPPQATDSPPDPAALAEALGLAAVPDRRVAELSLGYRRRLEIAAAIAGGPDLVLLDEPLDSLDEATREGLLARVRAMVPAAALVVATHRLEEAEGLTARRLALRS